LLQPDLDDGIASLLRYQQGVDTIGSRVVNAYRRGWLLSLNSCRQKHRCQNLGQQPKM
jgi:uncharacterized protein